MNAVLIRLIVTMCAVALSGQLFARGNSRDGFNFGASVKIQNKSDRGFGSDTTTKSNILSEDRTINPYAGFVIGEHLNLGMALSFENANSQSTEEVIGSTERVDRTRATAMRSVSLFGRFLFGESMFFEAGFGLYDQSVNVENQYTFGNNDNSFTGKRESYSIRGVGPGYHAGGGFEIEMGRRSGFFLTATYMVRSYDLKQVEGESSLGEELSSVTRQEVAFGLAHYVN